MSFAATLEIRRGDECREFVLGDAPITVGRAIDNRLVLTDPLVSRHHARLEWSAGALVLTDLGSSNPTQLGGVEIEPQVPHPLTDGDIVRIGDFVLTLRLPHVEDRSTLVPDAAERTFVPQEESPTIVPTVTPRLVVTTATGMTEFRLDRESLVLGRDPACDIVVDDHVISRRHAQLQRVPNGYEITDLGSANGLTFQGTRVPKRLLADGDVLGITQAVSLTYKTTAEAMEAPEVASKLDLRGHSILSLGRGAQNDIPLQHPAVSRAHARIVRRGQDLAVEDLGSANGTFVNGDRVATGTPHVLHPGDTIRVGPIKFVFSPEAVEQVDESRDLRLDALHLNHRVGRGINLLQDISLAILPREFTAIVGVSGAGKSTLLNALNGFRPAREGKVLVNGTDLYRHFDAYRTAVGYVPQDDIIHKELSVNQALDYAARLRLPADTTPAERTKRVAEVLETLGLTERRDISVRKLSGGQRKRVSIGVELLTQPGLFFLDEATSGLDPGTESQMMRLLRHLADQGHTILLVTHATKNVMLCDQVAFLAKGGYLAYFGPPEQALEFFGVQDFDAIYEKLERESTPEAWQEKYRQSPQYQKFIVARLQEKYGALIQAPASVPHPTARPRPWGGGALRQLWILSLRYLSIIRRDRMNLLLLLLIAPVLGSIDFITWPHLLLDPVKGDPGRGVTFLFLSAIVPFLVGSLSSVREIVKETSIYRRERAVTLKIAPYLLSKIWIGFLFALYHAAMLLVIKMAAVDMSSLSLTEIGQFYVTLALAAMSGVMWGLLVSAIAPREEQAMLLVIVVIVAQIFFSGGILPLKELTDAGQRVGDVTSTKWAFQALTTLVRTVNDRFGAMYGGDLYASWVAMALIMVGLYAIVYVIQRRKDVV